MATEWKQFANANLQRVRELMKLPIIFNGRNVMHAGFECHSIGRKSLYPQNPA